MYKQFAFDNNDNNDNNSLNDRTTINIINTNNIVLNIINDVDVINDSCDLKQIKIINEIINKNHDLQKRVNEQQMMNCIKRIH